MANIIPPRRNELLTKDGMPTRRFIEYLEQLTITTNSSTDQIIQSPASDGPINRAKLAALENRIGSGNFLTSDETGFSVDNNKFTVDMDES
jgi:hypothetical protein